MSEQTQYLCLFCKQPLMALRGSKVRPDEGFSLFCANKDTCATEVYGYGRTIEKAFEIICQKYGGQKEEIKIKEIRPDIVREEIKIKQENKISNFLDKKVITGVVKTIKTGKKGRPAKLVPCNKCENFIYTSVKAKNGGFCDKCKNNS